MDIWQRGTSALTATTAGAYTADGWIVLPTGASVTAAQATGRSLTVNSFQVTGAASVTDLIVKQRIESYTSAPMTSQQVTFQAWVFNSTGGSITPTLTVKHPTAADNYTGTATDVSAVSLQPCGNAAWTQISYTFAASSSSAFGMEVGIDFGNNFSSGAKSIQITECDLRVTPGVPSGLNYAPPVPQFRPIHEELVFCQRYFTKSYSQSVAIGANVGNPNGAIVLEALSISGSTLLAGDVKYPVVMRTAPTKTLYDNAGASGNVSYYTGAWNNAGNTFSFFAQLDSGFGWVVGPYTNLAGVSFDYTASAEL
jgi:hypothetical protein